MFATAPIVGDGDGGESDVLWNRTHPIMAGTIAQRTAEGGREHERRNIPARECPFPQRKMHNGSKNLQNTYGTIPNHDMIGCARVSDLPVIF